MLINNSRFVVKSLITSLQGEDSTFDISEDLETGEHIETNGEIVSIVLQDNSGLERLLVTMSEGIATIKMRGLGKGELKESIEKFKRQWFPGTVGYITVLASDLLDIDSKSGKTTIETNIDFKGDIKFKGDVNLDGSIGLGKFCLPTFNTEEERDEIYNIPLNGDKCFLIGVGEQVFSGGEWNTLSLGNAISDATEELSGKVQIAKTSEMDDGIDIGNTGAILMPKVSYFKRKEFAKNLNISELEEQNNIDFTNKILLSTEDGNKYQTVDTLLNGLLFGNGSDGDVEVSTSIVLTRDMHYTNLNITSTGEINPNGYKIFIQGRLTGTGTIKRLGNNGSNGGDIYGGAGGIALNTGSIGREIAGGNGANAGTGLQVGSDGESIPLSYSNKTGARGGVAYSNNNRSSGGTSYRGPDYDKFIVIGNLTLPMGYRGVGGAGGGSGGYGNGTRGGGGGGGGNGGTIIVISREFDFAGSFQAKGGNGGAGGVAGGYPGGGGGGGSGGIIILVGKTFTNTGGYSFGGGSGGVTPGYAQYNGEAGPYGEYIKIQI